MLDDLSVETVRSKRKNSFITRPASPFYDRDSTFFTGITCLTLELPMIKQSSRVIAGNAMLAFMFIHSCKGVLFHRIKAGFVFMSSSLVTCQIIRFRDSVVSLYPGTLLRMSLLSVTQPHVSFFHARTGIHHDILARIGHTSCAKQCYLPCMRCSYSASLCRELPRNCRSAREVANCAPQAFSSPSATA